MGQPNIDPRSVRTRTAIIETAERMFGEQGLYGVSLRSVAAEIGAKNPTVVAYHFGDREALIDAIFRYRLPALDARRGELLAAADLRGDGHNLRALCNVLWRPFYEQHGETGHRSYTSFVLAMVRANRPETGMTVDKQFPATREVIARLRTVLGIPYERASARATFGFGLVAMVINRIDMHAIAGAKADRLFDESLDMVEAALRANLTPRRDKAKKRTTRLA